MSKSQSRPAFGLLLYVAVMSALGIYFAVASVQGDFGLFRRVQIEAEAQTLTTERDRLSAEVAALENKTRRMSDTYLDIELLDQQARDILGMIRVDEVVIQ